MNIQRLKRISNGMQVRLLRVESALRVLRKFIGDNEAEALRVHEAAQEELTDEDGEPIPGREELREVIDEMSYPDREEVPDVGELSRIVDEFAKRVELIESLL